MSFDEAKLQLEEYLSDKTCSKCHPNFVLHLTIASSGAENAASSNSGTWDQNDVSNQHEDEKNCSNKIIKDQERCLQKEKYQSKMALKKDSVINAGNNIRAITEKCNSFIIITHQKSFSKNFLQRYLHKYHTICPLRTQPRTPPSSFDGQIEYSTARPLKSSPGIQQQNSA